MHLILHINATVLHEYAPLVQKISSLISELSFGVYGWGEVIIEEAPHQDRNILSLDKGGQQFKGDLLCRN